MYSVQNYECPSNLCPTSTPGNEQGILTVARAKLDGGGRLELLNWYGKDVSYQSGTASGSFDNVGVGANGGGRQSPIFPKDPNASAASYASCQAGGSTPSTAQTQAAGSISYVPESNQYVLVFVCISPTNPATPDAGPESGTRARRRIVLLDLGREQVRPLGTRALEQTDASLPLVATARQQQPWL